MKDGHIVQPQPLVVEGAPAIGKDPRENSASQINARTELRMIAIIAGMGTGAR